MPEVVGVRMGPRAPVQFSFTEDGSLQPGDVVVVERAGQRVLGTLVIGPGQLVLQEVPVAPDGTARRATEAERLRLNPPQETSGLRLLRSLGIPE